jgi:hypothetical protein
MIVVDSVRISYSINHDHETWETIRWRNGPQPGDWRVRAPHGARPHRLPVRIRDFHSRGTGFDSLWGYSAVGEFGRPRWPHKPQSVGSNPTRATKDRSGVA